MNTGTGRWQAEVAPHNGVLPPPPHQGLITLANPYPPLPKCQGPQLAVLPRRSQQCCLGFSKSFL